MFPREARPATAVVGCIPPAVPAEEAGAKAAKAEAVDWVEAVADSVARAVTAGWVAVKGDLGSEAVDWVAALAVVGSEEAQEAVDWVVGTG